MLKKLLIIYSKKIRIKKLDYFNQWRIQIYFKGIIYDIYDSVYLRLYDYYKYKESYLQTLRIIYQLKENENYPFRPKINKEYNPHSLKKNWNNKKSSRNIEVHPDNYLMKTFNLSSTFSKFKDNIVKKEKKKQKKEKLNNIYKSSLSRNKTKENIKSRNNTFSNLFYLSHLKTKNSSSNKILALKKQQNSKNSGNSKNKNILLFPSNTIENSKKEVKKKVKKNNKINNVVSQRIKSNSLSLNFPDDSMIIKNLTIQNSKNKNKNKNKTIKLPNFTKLLEKNNKEKSNSKSVPYIIYDNINFWDSNDTISTLKNSKDLKLNENQKVNNFSPKIQNQNEKILPIKKNINQKLTIEDPLNYIELDNNFNNCIFNTEDTINSNNLNKMNIISSNLCIKGIEQESDRITIQTISDDKMLKQAKCYLSSDISLDNFIQLKKKENKKKMNNKLKK